MDSYINRMQEKENLCLAYMQKADDVSAANGYAPSKEECVYLQKAATLRYEMAQMSVGEERLYQQRKVQELNQRIKNIVRIINPEKYREVQEGEAEAKMKVTIRAEVNHFAADVAAELSGVDPQVTVDVTTADTPEFMIEDRVARSLISALYAAPHGVIAMSQDIEGLVETSTNLASVKMTEPGKIVVATSQRSSVESEKYDIAYQVECLFRLAGAEPTHGDGYPGWKPNMHSHIKDVAVAAYEELYQQTPAIKAIHAGLECGLFLTKYPQLDMISFGPTLRGVHSPDEMMHIPAVEKFWNHLVLILEKVAAE